jgi:hypothetical protein
MGKYLEELAELLGLCWTRQVPGHVINALQTGDFVCAMLIPITPVHVQFKSDEIGRVEIYIGGARE